MLKHKRRLLYIEDDEHLCSLFMERMQVDGYSVDFALTAKSGVEKFYSGSYDLIALDYALPDKPGLEVAKEILQTNPEMPIVMVTGMGSEQIAAEALSLGVSSYVIKKSEETFLEVLPATIARLLAKKDHELGSSEPKDLTTNKDFYESLANFSPVSIFVFVKEQIVFVNPAATTLLDATSSDELIGKSEARFRALVDNTPARITLVDCDGKFLLVNKTYADFAEVRESEIVGTSSLGNSWLPKEIVAKNLAEVREVVENKELIVRERTINPGKSDESHWDVTKFPVFNDQGDVIAVGGICMDITARIEAEKSLRLSENATELERKKLQTGIDSLKECFAYFDQNESLVNFNKSFAARYSYLGEDLKPGISWEEINRAVYRNTLTSSDFESEDDFVKQRREQRYTKDGPVLRKNNDGTWIMITESPTPDGGTVVTILDITDIKKVEEELEEARATADEANLAKSEFLSSMSHELRTPLNAILGFSQMLELDPLSPLSEPQSVSVAHIRKGGNYLLSLINDVLDLAKVEAGKLELSIEDISIDQVYDDCLPLIAVRADERNIKMSEKFSRTGNLSVCADHTAIRQILLNLLSNAVKYNREDGEVRIMIEEVSDGILRTSISDNGEGIPIDLQSELFQPFSRLGQETTSIEGTGIGLVVTKRLVESMQGRIGFESELGVGSTFWFELPRSQEGSVAKTIAKDLTEKESPYSLAGKVLYIEDNPANLALMEMVISRVDGLAMISAHTAELGLDLARIEKPDLIIMDINLPGMNGFQALRELRKFSVTRDTPVIALSANATKKDIEDGQKAGFLEYLTKPVDVKAITQAIDDGIQRNR